MLKRILLVGWLIVLALLMVPVAWGQTGDGGSGEGGFTDIAMYALLVGFFLPPVLSIVIQSTWSERLKSGVAFVACLAAGAGTAALQGDLTGKRFVSAALIVLTTGLATYRNFWKPTGVSPTIEKATTLGGSDEG